MKVLNIKKQTEGSRLTMFLEGRMDSNTSPEFNNVLSSSLDGVKELVIDFSGLEYISSAGLRVILMAQKKMNSQGTLEIIHVNEEIMNIFDITGFSDIIKISK